MSFQDDSHILSRLGILESNEESPRKIHHSPKKINSQLTSEKDRFVEVSIDGTADAKSDSDDEPIFDRNSLLSPNRGVKVYRRKHELSFTCVYLILLLTYLAVGISCPLPWVTQSRKRIPHSFLLQNTAGVLIGCLTGKLLCQRFNLVFLSFLATASLCCLSWTVSEFPEVVDARIVSCILGFVSGNILYAGLAIWLIYWRGYNRKALLLYVLIAIGSSIVVTTRDDSSFGTGSLGLLSPSVILHKRQADVPSILNETMYNSTSSLNSTSTTLKPRKPQIVEGIKTVETKSEQNEHMRKAAASNKTQPLPTTAAPNNSTAVISPKTSTVNDSRLVEITLPPSSPSTLATKATPSTRAAEFLQRSSTTSTISTPTPTGVPSLNFNSTNVRLVAIVTTTIIAFYILASIFCCIPCSVVTDLKFLRLYDPSVAGLTVGCRIRLASVQIIASFLEGLVELIAVALSLQQNTANNLAFHHIVVVISRATIMISGPITYSLSGCCIALLFSLVGSVLLVLSSADSSVGFTLVSAGTGVFGLLVFFYIELCVNPRGGTQLDYFIFPSVVGRCLCTALTALMPSADASQMIGVVLLANAPLLLLFILLVKSLRKAARLKEIMEYSSSPVMEAVGEYVSLIERDASYDSAEELDDDDGLAG